MTDTYLEKLAQATKPCPNCEGGSTIYGYDQVLEKIADLHATEDVRGFMVPCPACHGRDKVPLIPGLTRPCPGEDWGGSSQVPVSPAEVLVALWNFARSKDWQVLRGVQTTALIEVEIMGDKFVGQVIVEVDGTDVEALAEALFKALKVAA